MAVLKMSLFFIFNKDFLEVFLIGLEYLDKCLFSLYTALTTGIESAFKGRMFVHYATEVGDNWIKRRHHNEIKHTKAFKKYC